MNKKVILIILIIAFLAFIAQVLLDSFSLLPILVVIFLSVFGLISWLEKKEV